MSRCCWPRYAVAVVLYFARLTFCERRDSEKGAEAKAAGQPAPMKQTIYENIKVCPHESLHVAWPWPACAICL